MSKKPKRPTDINQLAKHLIDIATGNASDEKKRAHTVKSTPKKPINKSTKKKD